MSGIVQKESLEEERRWATECALKLEEQLALLHKPNKEYAEKARSLLFNLTDQNNKELKGRILRQELTPKQVLTTDTRKLASKEMQKLREATCQNSVQAARSDYMSMRVMEDFMSEAGSKGMFTCE